MIRAVADCALCSLRTDVDHANRQGWVQNKYEKCVCPRCMNELWIQREAACATAIELGLRMLCTKWFGGRKCP